MNVSQDLTSKHSPPKMPHELWTKVFSNLELQDVKAVRLTWRVWTDIGSRFMFQPFVFRIDRMDLERFEMVTKNAAMAAGIRHIRFEPGTINIHYTTHVLGFAYLNS
jgi:hypothetical protein